MKVAGKISKTVAGRELTREQKKKASPVVHYAFGSSMGALYGALAEHKAMVRQGFGLPFATAVFISADEIGVPAFGLSASPLETKAEDHLYGWVSHLVYGATTELVRRGVRSYI